MTAYQEAILQVVRRIPPGKVASYGQVAAYVGTPRSARQVGWAMHGMQSAPDFPWWRVLNNAGRITIKGGQINSAQLQRELLESEGVVISDALELDIAAYRYRPDEAVIRSFKLDPAYIQTALAKFGIG